MKTPNTKFKLVAMLVTASCLSAASTGVFALTTAADVERLGKDLTPTGAEKAGNADGTIPAWSGGLTKAPEGFDPKAGYIDPFAAEKPLFTITAANAQQYKDKLTAGQLELLKRYPTYKMNVYPSHRTAAFPQRIYDSAKSEATKITLDDGGNSVKNVVRSTIPFPLPKSGVEVIWNHSLRYRGPAFEQYTTEFPVQSNGSFTPVKRTEIYLPGAAMENPEPNRLFYEVSNITGPSSMAGESVLLHESIDQVKEPRKAWTYNPGSRRVYRAPDVAYDSPGQGSDGLRTNDEYDGYNGLPDRYEWKLVGKKEYFVAYNNYKLLSKRLKYSEIIGPSHLNQDLVRYEPHRVWVVEATLKPGQRHIYAKRVFYVDEDSWQLLHVDAYDGRGELWRVHEISFANLYDAVMPYYPYEVHYDLQARRYLARNLSNEEKLAKYGMKLEASYFAPDNLRRIGN